jgi:hypothetical protein
MSLDPKLPIKLELNLNEVEGILAGLGELPTKTNAFALLMKIQSQVQMQVPPPEESAISDVNPEDIKPA